MAAQQSDLGSGQPITALPDSGTPLVINGVTTLAAPGAIMPIDSQVVTVAGTAHVGDALALTVTPSGGSPVVLSYSVLSTQKSVTVAGTPQVNDILGLTITPSGGSPSALSYTMLSPDTANTAAIALAALVNADAGCIAHGITASVPSSGVFNVLYTAAVAPTVAVAVTGTTPTTTLAAGAAATTSAALQRSAAAVAALVNASATLAAAFITASAAVAGVFNVLSTDTLVPTVSAGVTGGGATTTMVVGADTTTQNTVTPTASFSFMHRGQVVQFRYGQSANVSVAMLAALSAASAPYTTP